MASQVQLSNTFNEFRTAYNNAANDISVLQSSVSTLNTVLTGSGSVNSNTVQVAQLTAGRVLLAVPPVSGTGALLSDDSGLTYDTSLNRLNVDGAVDANGAIRSANVTANNLTSGRVLIAGTSGLITDDSGLTYVAATDSLSASGSITASTWANAANIFVSANATVTDTVNALGHVHVGGVEDWITAKGEDRDIHLIAAVDDSDGPHDIAIVNRNNNANAYGEFIAMNNSGNTEQGWVSMGINATNYNQGAFAITKGDDAYLLYQAPEGTTKSGDLVIGTGGNGTGNKIIFSANGFDDPANNTQLTIDPGVRVHIEVPTQSVSTTTGALTVAGGLGVVGNMNVGGNVTITGTISLLGSGNTVSTDTLAVANSLLFLANGNAADTLDIGIIGEYTQGTKKYFGFARDQSDNSVKFFQDASTKPANTINFAEAGINYSNVRVGVLHSSNTTATSSPATGALIVTGGAGIGGGVWAGGAIRTDDTTATTSTSTGALIVAGGAGIAGNTHIGSNLVVDTSTFVVDATNNRVGVGATNPQTDVEIRTAAPVLRLQEGTTGGDKRLELSVSAAGEARISANQSAQNLDFFLAGTRQVTFTSSGNVAIYATTASTTTATGALVVGGGAGISGNTNIGGNIVVSGNITAGSGSITDSAGNLRRIPQNSQTTGYTLVVGDLGKHISITTGGVTVPANVFSAGDVVTIYNNSASTQTITQGTSLTLRLAGTATTGNRSLALRGIATVLFISATEAVINGGGLT